MINRKKRQNFVFAFMMSLALILTGCGSASPAGTPTPTPPQQTSSPEASPSETPSAPSSIRVTDRRGVEVVLDKAPENVISLMPSDTEILYALGAGDLVTAVSEYCNYPEATASKEKLATGEKLSVEALIEKKPDVVFLGAMSSSSDQIAQLESAGVKIIVTEANSLEETYKVISMMGTALGREEAAEELVLTIKTGLENIRKSSEGKTAKTVFIEVSPLQYGLWTCGSGTFIQELLEYVGAKNIFADLSGWASVSEEQVLSANPDFIITTASPLTGIEDPIGDITGRTGWDVLTAVKENQVYMLDGDMLSRPGPRLLDAAGELQKIIYGE